MKGRAAPVLAVALGLAACSDGSTAPPRVPASLELAGNGQLATVGSALPQAPGVRVLDGDGEPVAGVEVTFLVTGGGGTVEGGTQRTDGAGLAQVTRWILGPSAGSNLLSVRAGPLTALLSATANPGPPSELVLVTELPATVLAGLVFSPQPMVEVRDEYGNPAAAAALAVTASLASGASGLQGTTTVPAVQGRAQFTDLAVTGDGPHQVMFSAGSLAPIISRSVEVATTVSGWCTGAGALKLDLPLGHTVRRTMLEDSALSCLEFDPQHAAGHQYLVLLENLPPYGPYAAGLFPGTASISDFMVTLTALPATFAGGATPGALRMAVASADPTPHGWDYGGGTIHEAEVVLPPGVVPEPRLLRNGALVALSSVVADPRVGDTVVVRLEGIPRLSIASGEQRAVIRHISPELVFAEDVRLQTTLRRPSGGFNSPMSPSDMQAIAAEYAAYARPQSDALFDHRHNGQTESGTRAAGRVLAVHTLMPEASTWGYTYSVTDYFAFDYWVATDGVTKGHNQVPQRIADDLFMHEIAHMRHCGLLERAGRSCLQRGNRWLVEGFARFSERLPIAMRLLGQSMPGRDGNFVLPLNPAFGGDYFFDDVPTYLHAGSNMFGGYGASSFVFDYFADLVAARGAGTPAALRDFLVSGATPEGLDAAIGRWLPGLTFGELFTRARVALYADDYGTPELPAFIQYQQFRLRESRPPGSRAPSDPRQAWPHIEPGILSQHGVRVEPGAAWGYLIDGSGAHGAARIDIGATSGTQGVVSITRIR
ncbi:MAG TPA: hypothetical protein VK939_04440 [Longimicrobiales bacterium]|nr:hypothetical protein [Longimicrobiales bacterium]